MACVFVEHGYLSGFHGGGTFLSPVGEFHFSLNQGNLGIGIRTVVSQIEGCA